MISLNQLLERLDGDLCAVTHPPFAAVTVTGVHISELDDPTPYLEGGELLLTTGIPLRGGGPRVRDYVDRLIAREVAALGLGLGVGIDAVPTELRDATAACGLPLFTVPAGTPFMAVSRGYWDLVGRREQAQLSSTLRMQTSLARAATRPEAVDSVLRVLSEAVGGWAAWLPGDAHAHRVGHGDRLWPSSERGVLPSLREETMRLNLTGSRSSATFPLHGMDVVEYSVVSDTGAGSRSAGFLAVAAGRGLGRADRQLMLTACMLLAIIAQQGWQLSRANATVGRIAATLILSGYVDAARLAVDGRDDTMLSERVRVLAVKGPGLDVLGSAELASRIARLDRASTTPGFEASIAQSALRCDRDGLTFVIIPAVESAALRHELVVEQRQPIGTAREQAWATPLRAAIGPPVLLAEVAATIAELTLAAQRARPGSLRAPEQSPEARSEAWVEALRSYSRADLLTTVRSYVRHRGQWEACARELGIHRNSLRHRIGVASTLIDADLNDPDVTAPLWLALRRSG